MVFDHKKYRTVGNGNGRKTLQSTLELKVGFKFYSVEALILSSIKNFKKILRSEKKYSVYLINFMYSKILSKVFQ